MSVRPSRRVLSLLAVVLGLSLVLAGSLVWRSHQKAGDPASFGSSTARRMAAQTPSSTARTNDRTGPATTVPVVPGTGSTAAAAATPTRVSIAAIGVSAQVVPVGVTSDGQMAIPEDVHAVGWYRWSAPPGATAGSTVLAGHVDSATQGLGSLFRLRQVAQGAQVELRTSDGKVHRYRVIARESFPKTRVPLGQIFRRSGSPRLTIVTCGGVFDASKRSYESNIVVTAVPV
ncbi:MAG: class F sortase [Jatrophihabitans sp.]